MFVEISRDFIYDKNISPKLELDLSIEFSISEIIDFLEIQTYGCAVFYVNGKERKKDYNLKNKDTLLILPIFGGG